LSAQGPDHGEHPVPAPSPKPDGRKLWDWETKYETPLPHIKREAKILGAYLVIFGLLTVGCFALANDFSYVIPGSHEPLLFLRRRDVLVWFVGSVGGTVFAIKWLMHSVAKGLWHQDRFLWRVFVPLTGGIYALVVLALMNSGFMGGAPTSAGAPDLMKETVIAFLAGYFADGVSGLLTNIANAIFGQVDKK
jgi:hypothetical protein